MKICLACEGITETGPETCTSCGLPLTETDAVHFPLRRGEALAGHPLLGKVLDGKYLIQGVLGKGGMGTVFRAIHQVSLVPVALKVLNPRFARQPEYRAAFLAEAQKAGRVVHEHVARVLDVGEAEDGTVYLAMEEVTGSTLFECIHAEVRLAPEQVVDILLQISRALGAAHAAGLVHRDLSPRNIMVVVRDGRPFVKILDFGIAKGVQGRGGEGTDLRFANPPYSAPEHLAGGDIDARADLYSLGVVAYEALTQRLPAAGDTTRQLADATVSGRLEPLQPPKGTPPRLGRLIRELLAKDPDRRPQSAGEVAERLEELQRARHPWFRDVVLLLLLLGVLLQFLPVGVERAPQLSLRSGRLPFLPTLDTSVPAPELRSAELERLSFDFSGFAPQVLSVEASGAAGPLFDQALRGEVFTAGRLRFDAEQTPDYRTLLERVAEHSRAGVVTLGFRIPGRAQALGYARLRIDDLPPQPALSLRPAGRLLRQDSRLELRCEEAGTLRQLRLRLLLSGGESKQFDMLERSLDVQFALPDLFPGLQSGPAPLRGVRLRLEAEDQAGNRDQAELGPLEIDLRLPQLSLAPVLRAVRGGGQRGGARLDLQVDVAEDGLKVYLVADGEPLRVPVEQTGTQLQLSLSAAATSDFRDGPYGLILEDPAGNRVEQTCRIQFVGQGPDLQLHEEPRLRRRLAQVPGFGPLFWSGEALEFGFTCNEYYRPVAVSWTRDGARLPAPVPSLELAGDGSGRIRLPAPGAEWPDGELGLQLRLRHGEVVASERVIAWPLRLQRRSMVLQLPPPPRSERVHLQEVVEQHLFRRDPADPGQIHIGDAWQLQPRDLRLVRGRGFWGPDSPDLLTAFPIPVGAGVEGSLLPALRLQRGGHLLCLQLRDLLGRPVRIMLGKQRAKVLHGSEFRDLSRVAWFDHQERVVEQPVTPPLVESGQPTRIRLRSRFRFAPDEKERIRLSLPGLQEALPCVDLAAAAPPGDPEGTELGFVLPFDELSRVLPQGVQLPLEDGQEFRVDLQLFSPAGQAALPGVVFRGIRSSLRSVELAELGVTQAVLKEIRMVPVLPRRGVQRDLVPAELRRRGRFLRRREVDVNDLGDVFLQDRELSREAYWSIVQRFTRKPRRAPDAAFLFAGDPAGAGRLSLDGMRPELHGEAEWARLLRDAPAAPVAGLNFYQAYTVCRLAGEVLFGDPATLRLPFGAEFEAALRAGPRRAALNGLTEGISPARVRQEGDVLITPLGRLHGIDFGLREWVFDLPWPSLDPGLQAIVASWMGDHDSYLVKAELSEVGNLAPQQLAHLRLRGVVRGLATAELGSLRELAQDRLVPAEDPIPALAPGAVVAVAVARSGAGLSPGELDPLLGRIGMRLAGAAAFIERVRKR